MFLPIATINVNAEDLLQEMNTGNYLSAVLTTDYHYNTLLFAVMLNIIDTSIDLIERFKIFNIIAKLLLDQTILLR